MKYIVCLSLATRSFSEWWLLGANLVRTSNIQDHVRVDQHTQANVFVEESASESK